jgi:hypothetical protein
VARQSSLKYCAFTALFPDYRHTKALDAFYDFMHSDASPVKAELR